MKNEDLSATFCGSKSYSAPEILTGSRYSPLKADVWSLGVIAFVLVTNRMPFNERVPSNSVIVEAQRARTYRYSRRLHISATCQKTIDAMLTFDWRKRPSVVDIARSEWFALSDQPALPTAAGDSVISPS
uniref:Protein kinase domain-containing protein n=1 Tax=Plectus sambesii TaxID=2011161 RepID=A0A914VJY7_9BILA